MLYKYQVQLPATWVQDTINTTACSHMNSSPTIKPVVTGQTPITKKGTRVFIYVRMIRIITEAPRTT